MSTTAITIKNRQKEERENKRDKYALRTLSLDFSYTLLLSLISIQFLSLQSGEPRVNTKYCAICYGCESFTTGLSTLRDQPHRQIVHTIHTFRDCFRRTSSIPVDLL